MMLIDATIIRVITKSNVGTGKRKEESALVGVMKLQRDNLTNHDTGV